MPVVDASVVVALFRTDEPSHAACRAWIEGALAGDEPVAAPTLLLAEVAAALARGLGDEARARSAVASLLQGPLLELHPITTELARSAADLAATCRLRGADAVYAALARALDTPLVTLDRQQQERAAAVVATQEP